MAEIIAGVAISHSPLIMSSEEREEKKVKGLYKNRRK